MGSSSDRSKVSDLAFRVFDRASTPTGSASGRTAGWPPTAGRRTSGSSTAATRSPGGRARSALTEVLAGPPTPLPEAGLLFRSPVRHERTASLCPSPGIEYQACLEVERVDAEVFAHLCDEMALDAGRDRLFHRSSGANRMAPPAISHLAFESRARGLLVHAFHSFPAERAIVRTQSLFEAPIALPAPR